MPELPEVEIVKKTLIKYLVNQKVSKVEILNKKLRYTIQNQLKKLVGKKILKIYFYHLIINFTWSFVFFYYHLIFAAFINIIFLIAAIVILMVLYFPKSKSIIVGSTDSATIC